MKISVTEQDIKLGIKTPSSNTICPVARAIRRVGFKGICVAVDSIYSKKNPDRLANLDPKAVRAIHSMCLDGKMEPFTFTLLKKDINYLLGN